MQLLLCALDGYMIQRLTRPVRCLKCKAHGEALVTPAGLVAPAGWWRLFAAERFYCSAACALEGAPADRP